MRFSLNHSIAPLMPIPQFLALAGEVGVDLVELRDGMPPGWEFPDASNVLLQDPGEVASMASDLGLQIASINALQRFDQWDQVRAEQARAMIDFAAAAGIDAIVLCPSVAPIGSAALPTGLAAALDGLQPLLEDAGIQGLVEPLGFPRSSIRTKAVVDEELATRGNPAALGIVHDSFHHAIATDQDYSSNTRLVHLSAVPDLQLPLEAYGDEHRILLGPDDITGDLIGDVIGNVHQVRRLKQFYQGPWSLEPFASQVGVSPTLPADLRACLDSLLRQADSVD